MTFLQNAIKRGFVGGEYHPNTNICEIVVSQYKIIRQVVVLFVIILSIITKFVIGKNDKKITKTYAEISDNALSIRTGFKMTNYMVNK